MQLSDRAKELIPKARIVSFDQWEAYLSAAIAQRFQDADDASRYLSDEDFVALQPLAEPSAEPLAEPLEEPLWGKIGLGKTDILKLRFGKKLVWGNRHRKTVSSH